MQPCPRVQMVPSVQNPEAGVSPRRFVPHVPGDPSVSRPDTYIEQDLYPPVYGPHCMQSLYGCCPDGHTSATGPRNQGCPQHDCAQSRYGCCLDGVTPAQGVGRAGCPQSQRTEEQLHGPLSVDLSSGNVCLLPRDEGPCDTWMVRFAYDRNTGKCKEFWYGGCQGNHNNFRSMEACRRQCEGVATEPAPARGGSRRGSLGGIARARAQLSRRQLTG